MTALEWAVAGLCAVFGVTLAPVLALLARRIPTLGPQLTGAPAWTDGHRVPTGALAALSGLGFLAAGLRWSGEARLVPHLLLVAALVVASAIDLEHARLPDRLVLPTLAMGVAAVAVFALVDGRLAPVLNAALGALVMSGVLAIIHLVHRRGMGFGDVKLALVLGLFLGWAAPDRGGVLSLVLLALLAASLLGTITGLVLLAVRRTNEPYPFGPSLALGTFTVLVLAPLLVDGS